VETVRDLVVGGVRVLKHVGAGSEHAAALAAEAALLADLTHPHIARVTDRFVRCPLQGRDHRTGFAMEWVDGAPLGRGFQRLPLPERLAAAQQLVGALQHLHRNGVLHLDLKPENVLYGDAGVVVLDLGTARPVSASAGEAGGTLGFAAPEVLQGLAAGVASDVYSLGALLYEVLAGKPAHGELKPERLRRACLVGDIIPIRALRPDLPRPLAQLVERMLTLDPGRRPSLELVVQTLEEEGGARSAAVGDPRYQGRHDDVLRLSTIVRQHACVAIIGPKGAGRRRLAHHLLLASPRAEERSVVVDLSMHPDPIDALGQLEMSRTGLAVQVLLPEHSGDQYEALQKLTQASGDRLRLLLPSTTPLRGWAGFHLAPMGDSGLRDIALRAGQTEVDAHLEASGGWPGALLQQVRWSEGLLDGLSQAGRAVWDRLWQLPAGVPSVVLQHLGVSDEGVQELVHSGLARVVGDGRLFLDRTQAGPIDAGLAAALLPVLSSAESLDPLWVSLALARMGQIERSAECFDAVASRAAARPEEVLELCELLAPLRDDRVVELHARTLYRQARYQPLLEELGHVAGSNRAVHSLLAESTLALGNSEGAQRIAEQGVAVWPDWGKGWTLLARLQAYRGEIPNALESLARADALPGDRVAELVDRIATVQSMRRLPQWAEMNAAVLELAQGLRDQGRQLPAAALGAMARALGKVDRDRAILLFDEALETAELEGRRIHSAGYRLNQGNLLAQVGRKAEARRRFLEAWQIALAIGADDVLVRVAYTLADFELFAGRMADARRWLQSFEDVAARVDLPEAPLRGAVLRARLALADNKAQPALTELQALVGVPLPKVLAQDVALLRAEAHLLLERPQACLDELAPLDEISPKDQPRRDMLRGRAHMALGRLHLGLARDGIPTQPEPSERELVGQVLLAHAGEDIDPDTLEQRKSDLELATRLLTGAEASLAATLRDSFLDGPGAHLERIAALTEAMNDPRALPEALAQLVSEALGAHRALVMLALPGLGRQVNYKELTNAEAHGIGQEVVRRIQQPKDVWLAADAFADPALREASATVRTFEIKSLLAVAIPYGGKAVGALYVDDIHRPNRFSEPEVRVLQRLAAAVGGVIGSLRERRTSLEKPVEVLGVRMTDRDQVERVNDLIDQMKGQEQLNLLITGPTGVGKTWFARRVANEVLGCELEEVVLRRADPQMLVSLLMGAQRGEYTGAIAKSGAIQRAVSGRRALFLDEIQTLDEDGQQVLLPLLELPQRRFGGLTGSAHPVGGPLHVILGTNIDVSSHRWAEHFRADLWYRMSELHVDLPPLAERGPQAVYEYLDHILTNEGAGNPEDVFEIQALHRVTSHVWPGNLRELAAFSRRAAGLRKSQRRPLRVADLQRCGFGTTEDLVQQSGGSKLAQVQVETVIEALRRANWLQIEAASALGMTKYSLSRFLKRHGLRQTIKERRDEHLRLLREEAARHGRR
jgi:DNA-binding NtrC family response regulator/tetratricopeptide (TPR) repeat protein